MYGAVHQAAIIDEEENRRTAVMTWLEEENDAGEEIWWKSAEDGRPGVTASARGAGRREKQKLRDHRKRQKRL
jgi:hypothetical protein